MTSDTWLVAGHQPELFHPGVWAKNILIDQLGDVYPELRQRAKHIIDTTRAEEQRFLDTIDGGMKRFETTAAIWRAWAFASA